MDRFLLWLAGLAALVVCVSCTAELTRSEADLVEQSSFDFTVVADRALFQESGLEFRSTVGPYAVYEVTGDQPSLLGPRVSFLRSGGYVMLCGGSGYFTPEGERGDDVTMTLYGGEDGEEPLTQTAVLAITSEDCATPDDKFTDRVPDETSEMVELRATAGERIAIALDGSVPLGSLVLLRAAALDVPQRDHNDSHVTPSICCEGDFCTLD